jgi:Chaperone of endosialidase
MNFSRARTFALITALTLSTIAFAAEPSTIEPAPSEAIVNATITPSAIQWDGGSASERTVLTISGPDYVSLRREFRRGAAPVLGIDDLGLHVPDGAYSWELRTVPFVSAAVRRKLVLAREAGDEDAVARIRAEAGLDPSVVHSGSFTVAGGAFVSGGEEAPERNRAAANTAPRPVSLDQVTADDLIVLGSACLGVDCVDNESFGLDSIRLKENNTRIRFEDTSTGTCPGNDWLLTANDACPGASNFKIEDVTGAKVPLTITAGAPTGSLFIDSTGRLGLRTSTPALDLHVATSNTPAFRLEQNNAGGFAAQTWDVGGNEAGFFVRDATGGSLLPLRIRPGAPESSVDVSASGKVGIGTAAPAAKLDIRGTNAHVLLGSGTTDFIGASQTAYGMQNGTEKAFFGVQSGLAFFGSVSATGVGFVTNNSTKMFVSATGNVGIGTAAPGAQLVVANGGTTSSLNAGATQFTVASSRTFKENIEPVAAADILTKIEAVPVVTYDFRDDGPKDRMGLIAEDFHKVFGRGSEKFIDGQDVQMALWLAVQQLTAQNESLQQRLQSLEQQLASRE